jgi:predicted extracellular nuclease
MFLEGKFYRGRSDMQKRLALNQASLGVAMAIVLTSGCSSSSVTIMDIQGTGHFSPLQGRISETSGVVTFVDQNGEGFFIQDPAGDGDPATSDGIFVSIEGAQPGFRMPVVGDIVRLRGQVEELQIGSALPRTQISGLQQVDIQASGNPLPASVELENLPTESLNDGKAYWEPLEGMWVGLHNGLVVAPTNSYGEFAALVKPATNPGSGFFPENQHILLRSLGDNEVDYNPERIQIAEETDVSSITVRPGDEIVELLGVVDYTFGNYKIRPSHVEVQNQGMPEVPVSTRTGPDGDFVITTFNVENLFDLENDPEKDDEGTTPSPEELETKLRKLEAVIRAELRLPDIIVVQEVENATILAQLAERVNHGGGTSYRATSLGSSDRRGIENGFLWDQQRVVLKEAKLLSGPGVEKAFGSTSESPGREPLVGSFDVHGRPIIVVGNHFRSKGGDDPLFGINDPPHRRTEAQRKAQARVVRDYADSILDNDPSAWVVIAGDLNDFQFGEPGEGPDHPLAILEGSDGQVALTNLVLREDEAERFTYIYQGNSQVLDHILVSPQMLERLAAVDILHFDASYPAAFERDSSIHLRASDHDAVEARFQLR